MNIEKAIEKLNELAVRCKETHTDAVEGNWYREAERRWNEATAVYRGAKEMLEVLGFEVTREEVGNGKYSHTVKEIQE